MSSAALTGYEMAVIDVYKQASTNYYRSRMVFGPTNASYEANQRVMQDAAFQRFQDAAKPYNELLKRKPDAVYDYQIAVLASERAAMDRAERSDARIVDEPFDPESPEMRFGRYITFFLLALALGACIGGIIYIAAVCAQ